MIKIINKIESQKDEYIKFIEIECCLSCFDLINKKYDIAIIQKNILFFDKNSSLGVSDAIYINKTIIPPKKVKTKI